MGFYQALTSSRGRFTDVLPAGFKRAGEKTWLIQLDGEGTPLGNPTLAADFHPIPKAPPGRTSGVVATLIVDKATYALGIGGHGSRIEHARYLKIIRKCRKEIKSRSDITNDSRQSVDAIYSFLRTKKGRAYSAIGENDIIVFLVGNHPYLFSDPKLRAWLSAYQSAELSDDTTSEQCVTCGKPCSPARIADKVTLFRQRVPISAVNLASACSEGKDQLLNSPICMHCSAAANSILAHLIGSEAHPSPFSVVLVGDEKARKRGLSAGGGKKEKTGRPMTNQLAIFWTKEPVTLQAGDDAVAVAVEDVVSINLNEEEEERIESLQPWANPDHLKGLLESPWYCRGEEVAVVPPIGFYFAIISPNKSRLVIREWIETSIQDVKEKILTYRQGISIINPLSEEMIVPPVRGILQSLRAPSSNTLRSNENPRLAEVEPELLRQLIRCMYQGAKPPEALLTRAVQAFRSPAVAADEGDAFARLCSRRTALAAAIKLVLTYDKPIDMKAMEQLETPDDADSVYKRQSSYLCGRLLALLNNIQYRASASRRGPNTTLVDKFYAAASTAPQSVFGSLLKMANTAHLPKIRKDSSRNYPVKTKAGETHVTDLLNELVNLIDSALEPGLPRQLTPRQQAEFALGYHHQQAVLNPPYKPTASEKPAST